MVIGNVIRNCLVIYFIDVYSFIYICAWMISMLIQRRHYFSPHCCAVIILQYKEKGESRRARLNRRILHKRQVSFTNLPIIGIIIEHDVSLSRFNYMCALSSEFVSSNDEFFSPISISWTSLSSTE